MRQAFGRFINYLMLVLLLVVIQGCTYHVPHPPVSLTAAHNPITLGDSTTLTPSWGSSSASGTVDQGIGAVANGVPVTIKPTVDTTYTLTYSDSIGTIQTAVTVRVVGGPAITSLTAAAGIVTAGTGTTLTAVFAGGTGTLDNGIGTVTSGVPIPTGNLAADTTFTLTDTNAAGGFVTSTVTVRVAAAAGTPIITAPAFATAGAASLVASVPAQPTASFAWTISGGTITSGAATNQILFTAGASGAVSLGCVVTNAAGTPAPQATATCTIVAPPAVPVITAPATVTASTAGLTASVPAQAGSSYTWSLTGGAITAGAGTTLITFTAGSSGTVQMSCVVTNAAGTSSAPGTASTAIVAAPGTPVVTAPAFVTAGAAGLTASVPAVAGDSYAWTITGGTITAGGATSVITFTADATGTVKVSCVVTNAAGTAAPAGVAFCSIVAAPVIPVVSAQAAVTAGTTGHAASITNSAAEPAGSTYAWTVTGGTLTGIATGTSITFTAGASGSVLLSCKVTTTASATSTGTFTSTIDPVPVSTITAPASITSGASGTASVPPQTGSSYVWTIAGGSITAGTGTASISFTAGASGSVVLGCTVTNGAGTASAPGSATVGIVAAPTATITAPASITGGTSGAASVPTQGGSSYAWTISGGTITAGTGSASITFLAGASGSVVLGCTVTNTLGVASAPGSATVSIVAAPVATITAPASIETSTSGTASVPSQTGSSYAWTISGGSITAGAGSASITFLAGASGSVVLGCTVTNSLSVASAPGSATVTIVAAPVATITAPASIEASTSGTASVPSQGTSSYAWTITGGSITAGTGTASITFLAGASGSVVLGCTVTNTLGVASAPGSATVAIVAAPVATITAPPTIAAGATGAASVPAQGGSFAWTITGGSISTGAGTASITFLAGASGSVVLGCTVTNTLGVASAPGSATVGIVVVPVISAPANVAISTPGFTATISNAGSEPAGSTYAWTISTGGAGTVGTIDSGNGTASISFTAGTGTPLLLDCKVTASGTTADSGPLTISNIGGLAVIGVLISDATNEDWATIGVKVLSVGLVPQGGATPVSIYTAPTPAPVTNLIQLDQLSELLNQASVPPGTYTGAVLTLAGNPGDVALVSAANPSAGFPAPAAAAVPAGQIQIQNLTGTPGSLTVPVTVPFPAPVTVGAGQGNPLDLEFDLADPGFLISHQAAGDSAPFWALNFNGPVHYHPAPATGMVLRHLYATVGSVAADSTALTAAKVNPTWPNVQPETAQTTANTLTIQADAANGTLFYDLDAQTGTTLTDFSALAATLPGKYLRAAVRYQADGTLVAARLWAGSRFDLVYAGPEGHVLHVDTGAGTLTIADPAGVGVPLQVTAATRFFFRSPANPTADAAAIGSGPGFLGTGLVRGFKVHASVDPAGSPLTAQTVDIEAARFEGAIAASSTGFTVTRSFATAGDDYTVSLASSSGFPAAGPVDFGGGLPLVLPWAASGATWNDPANPGGWTASSALLEPTALPAGTVASAWSAGSFGLSLPGGANLAVVDLDVTGATSKAYQVDRTGAIVTVSPIDLATPAGQASLGTYLAAGATVKVYGIPQANGHIQATVVFCYTGTLPI